MIRRIQQILIAFGALGALVLGGLLFAPAGASAQMFPGGPGSPQGCIYVAHGTVHGHTAYQTYPTVSPHIC